MVNKKLNENIMKIPVSDFIHVSDFRFYLSYCSAHKQLAHINIIPCFRLFLFFLFCKNIQKALELYRVTLYNISVVRKG